ncbi:MAG: AAA family ATPase, partial [Gammaproteobacteria bacterium]
MVRGFAPELLVPSVFPHEVEHLELIETHISWIVLTGTVAYKFKKPVDFGFVDFSSLEKRRHACEEELRLNRRSAPTVYLGLVALVERDSGLALADAEDLRDFEPVIDYGVKMHEFPQSAQLDRQFREGLLTSGDMDEIAATVAALHEAASVAEAGQPWGEPDAVAAPARENF